MSLMIDVERVGAVLLADGWHIVDWQNGNERFSTFDIDAYEFIKNAEDDPQSNDFDVILGGGIESHLSATGASWLENDVTVYCPITSILAIKLKKGLSGTRARRKVVKSGLS